MKTLSRDEMKKVMGGFAPNTECNCPITCETGYTCLEAFCGMLWGRQCAKFA